MEAKRGRHLIKTQNFVSLSDVAAREHVHTNTVLNDARFAAAVDIVEQNVPGARETILAGESGLPKAEVVKLAKKPRAERKGSAGSVLTGPVRLHDSMAAPRAEAGVCLDVLTQWTGHALGIQDQIVALHDPHRARGAAPPGHTVAVASLVVVADVH